MIEKALLDNLVWHLLRGGYEGFDICSLIQDAVSYPKRIPKKFWYDENKGGNGIFGWRFLSKDEMRTIHDEVVEAIINEINTPSRPEEMYCDNYTRLFHALTLLGVEKSDERVPALGNDYMYNIAYQLWALDDGFDHTYNYVSSVSWLSSEAFKSGSRTSDDLITGIRHYAF